MDADWSVEMAHGDEVLEFPWTGADRDVGFLDLKRHPELVREVTEAVDNPPLRRFLSAINATESALQTAKCDFWCEQQAPDSSAAQATCSCYLDLLYDDPSRQVLFEQHERLVRELCADVEAQADVRGSAEFIVRRCFYHREPESGLEAGCYVTCYVHGYGPDETTARQNWSAALRIAQEAIVKCGRAREHSSEL